TAAGVLGREGWRCRDGMTPRWLTCRVVPRRHSISFSRDIEGQLDLHWHVLRGSIGHDADQRFWAAATPLVLAGEKAYALSAPDLLLHVLVHGVHSDNGGHVQWVADAVTLLRHRAETDADAGFDARFAKEARAHGVLRTVRGALGVVADIVGEEPVSALLARTRLTRPSALE